MHYLLQLVLFSLLFDISLKVSIYVLYREYYILYMLLFSHIPDGSLLSGMGYRVSL